MLSVSRQNQWGECWSLFAMDEREHFRMIEAEFVYVVVDSLACSSLFVYLFQFFWLLIIFTYSLSHTCPLVAFHLPFLVAYAPRCLRFTVHLFREPAVLVYVSGDAYFLLSLLFFICLDSLTSMLLLDLWSRFADLSPRSKIAAWFWRQCPCLLVFFFGLAFLICD